MRCFFSTGSECHHLDVLSFIVALSQAITREMRRDHDFSTPSGGGKTKPPRIPQLTLFTSLSPPFYKNELSKDTPISLLIQQITGFIPKVLNLPRSESKENASSAAPLKTLVQEEANERTMVAPCRLFLDTRHFY